MLNNGKETCPPQFNKSRDRALIDLNFEYERQNITVTATIHEVSGLWKLRGVHTTRATLPSSPAFEPVLRPVSRDNRQ
jgi:hypothetical protein